MHTQVNRKGNLSGRAMLAITAGAVALGFVLQALSGSGGQCIPGPTYFLTPVQNTVEAPR